MSNIEFKLVSNFKCKRCGCTKYDKEIFTGNKLLEDENSIIGERYVCRNCDFPININEYINVDSFKMTKDELLKEAIIIDDGIEKIKSDKGENKNE